MRRLLIASLTVVTWTTTAMAISPVIRTLNPAGGRRGTEVVVTISGQRLGDARQLLFYQPGIEAAGIKAESDTQIRATLKIDAAATPGIHDFRLCTATGITALRTFSVGVLPEIDEKEPNGDFAKPQPIAMDVTVNGVAATEDVDYYAIQAKKGERITAEIEGIRLGLTLFDPYVAILSAKRFELASSDDAALVWQDGLVSLIAPEDGTYIIQAREAAYKGNANCHYRLHVGHFPRPTATMPAGGPLGQSITLRWIGDVLGEKTSKLTLPAVFDPHFGVLARDAGGTAPFPNAFRLSPLGNSAETEPNDRPAAATPFKPPTALNGVIGGPGDIDRYVFHAAKGQRFDVRVLARQFLRSPLDSVLTITTKKGGRIAGNDDSKGPDSYVRFVAPAVGDYVLTVNDQLWKGGPDYIYRIEITPIEPRLQVSTPSEAPRRGTGIMAVAVPRGNRQAILLNAARVEFGGAVNLSATDLPAGVTFEADTFQQGVDTMPVLFMAKPDVTVGATLARVAGVPADRKVKVPCEFSSVAELVLGQNNVPFWTRSVESLAVAVTEEAPFTIEAVEPKVPLVQGGQMELKVVARRKTGFNAPIGIALPWNPPGVSSKREAVIPEGKSEGTILLNASRGAPPRSWKIVVNGTHTEAATGTARQGGAGRGRGRGRLIVSSEFARLSVAQPFLTAKFRPVSVEQGDEFDLGVSIQKQGDFPG